MSEQIQEMKKRMDVNIEDYRPCPFCGQPPKVRRLMGYNYWKTEISCCGFSGVDYDDEIQNRWNTRKEMGK